MVLKKAFPKQQNHIQIVKKLDLRGKNRILQKLFLEIDNGTLSERNRNVE
jgi:hypothetical protein